MSVAEATIQRSRFRRTHHIDEDGAPGAGRGKSGGSWYRKSVAVPRSATPAADTISAFRHPTASAMSGSTAAPTAPPKGKPVCFNPTAVARWLGGNHAMTAFVELGLRSP